MRRFGLCLARRAADAEGYCADRSVSKQQDVSCEGGHSRRRARHTDFEETAVRPKPMVEIGGKPILWHIMKMYSAHGLNDFVICCGYKGYVIKEYFANYFLHMSDVTFDMTQNQMHVHQQKAEPWRVTLVDTGDDTMTGGRLKRVADYLEGRRRLLLHLWRRRRRHRHRRRDRLPPAPRQAGDDHRGPAAGPLRRAGARGTQVSASSRSRAATAAGSTAASSSCRRRS